jgi:hypothetical protein
MKKKKKKKKKKKPQFYIWLKATKKFGPALVGAEEKRKKSTCWA